MMTKCLRCGGRGWVWIEPEKATRCPRCDGTGEGEAMIYSDIFQLPDGRWRCRIITEHLRDVFPTEEMGNDMQLEELIKDLNEEGYFISNLFQTRERSWQANLRTANGALQQSYGLGGTPYLALLNARVRMKEPKELAKPLNPLRATTGSELLASLGLRKAKEAV